MCSKLKNSFENWKNTTLAKSLSRDPEMKTRFENSSGIEVERLYLPEDEDPDYGEKLGFPGEFPFTRGVQPTMYRGRHWTMRMYAGFASAEESNQRYRYLIENGGTGLSVAFDLPTQMGYDSDSPRSRGEVGKSGVAIDSLEDMEILFKQIPLDKVSTSMTINSTASTLLALYMAVAEKQGVSFDKISGTVQNDLLKEYIARGTYIYPPEHSMRIITDLFAFCKSNVPKWNTISISGYHIREAGSTAVQEVAFTLANGLAYVKAALDKGLKVDDFASRLSFFFNSHNNFLEEVSKFRAARRLWARLMRERFKASDKSCMLRFHTQTGGSTLTAQQIDNNGVRVAFQALSAVFGGTQSLHTNGRDEALALPTEASATLALRTQQLIAYETGVTETIDPFAGSYAVEAMTDEIEKRALEYIERIDQLGGAVKAIEEGFQQREIQEAAYQYQKAIEEEKIIIVGVNKFQKKEAAMKDILRVNSEVETRQVERLKKLKANRDNLAVENARKKLTLAARTSENLMPHLLTAVRCYTSLGEISDTLREVFGVYRERIVI
ncbi:MAG: methylmalonyl-CoA mutase family protein [Deltaproteobacteria bacterium]|nr:methylmalonyl-CoA mutase family protein [Deltaproteobacteria bacterium]